jgi:hypothetical protein
MERERMLAYAEWLEKAIGWLMIALVVLAGGLALVKEIVTPAPGTIAPTSLSAQMPASERIFVGIVDYLAARYRSEANEMAQGRTRPVRRGALEEAFKDSVAADKWLGVVKILSSTNSGKGVLVVQIANNIAVGTMNNEIGDGMTEHTLIDTDTPVSDAAIKLHVGQAVIFSGHFVHSATDFYEEDSLTQAGSMTDPEFLFVFTAVAPVP